MKNETDSTRIPLPHNDEIDIWAPVVTDGAASEVGGFQILLQAFLSWLANPSDFGLGFIVYLTIIYLMCVAVIILEGIAAALEALDNTMVELINGSLT